MGPAEAGKTAPEAEKRREEEAEAAVAKEATSEEQRSEDASMHASRTTKKKPTPLSRRGEDWGWAEMSRSHYKRL